MERGGGREGGRKTGGEGLEDRSLGLGLSEGEGGGIDLGGDEEQRLVTEHVREAVLDLRC